jgi:hypothetical protein
MSEKTSTCPSLYFYSLKRFVREMDLTVKCLDKMCHLRLLPPAILSDIYREVSRGLLIQFLPGDSKSKIETKQLDLTPKNFHFSS